MSLDSNDKCNASVSPPPSEVLCSKNNCGKPEVQTLPVNGDSILVSTLQGQASKLDGLLDSVFKESPVSQCFQPAALLPGNLEGRVSDTIGMQSEWSFAKTCPLLSSLYRKLEGACLDLDSEVKAAPTFSLNPIGNDSLYEEPGFL
ncbi:hypothetical protein EOD39_0478 [Acipenser ruthenus]|uniref:Uncharacterized protein n=1 Tax=Acipenser ruthenus TaxID=7906 RepID=A0A444U337_ACIRT|nr:hypothetical protein EOD39_0478 [Acipenser ruthenus]